MNSNLKNILQKNIEKITGSKIKNFNPEADINSQIRIDSVQIIELFSVLENEFAVELPLSMMNVKSAKEFIELLEIELNNKA